MARAPRSPSLRIALVLGALALAGPAHAGPRQFAKAYERVQDAVVAVEARTPGGLRLGSGFVAGADGLVVCASQTVEGASAVRVHVAGSWREARVLAVDTRQRVALLHTVVEAPLRPVAVAKTPRLPLGSWVVAVERRRDGKAYPVAGTVAEVPVPDPRATRPPLVTVDAPAMPGSPLVNLKGEVVGLSQGRITARKGRAIELEPVRPFLQQAALAAR